MNNTNVKIMMFHRTEMSLIISKTAQCCQLYIMYLVVPVADGWGTYHPFLSSCQVFSKRSGINLDRKVCQYFHITSQSLQVERPTPQSADRAVLERHRVCRLEPDQTLERQCIQSHHHGRPVHRAVTGSGPINHPQSLLLYFTILQ